MMIRPATLDDLPAIVRIYNHAIETSVATFDLEPYTVEQRREWFAQFGAEHPLLVADDGGETIGFAYYLPYRSKPGYATTKETTVYVDSGHHRAGVGSALYGRLIEIARERGVHALVAVLGGQNHASEALHRKFGFEMEGRFPELGRKFGRWVDIYNFVKILREEKQ